MSTSSTAKGRLLEKLDAWIEAHERDVGVADQMNVIHAREERRLLGRISHQDAEQMESAIIEQESYDPKKDRFGFGPVTVSPINYIAFLNDEARQALGSGDETTTYIIVHWTKSAGLCCWATDNVHFDDVGISGAGYDSVEDAVAEALDEAHQSDSPLTNVVVCDLTDLSAMQYAELCTDMEPRIELLRLLDERSVPAVNWKK